MELTGRQSIYILIICFIATKVQSLPSLVASGLGRFGWTYFLVLGLLDVVFILIALKITELAKGKTLYELIESMLGKACAKIVSGLFFIYFIVSAILPYEAFHNVFGNILFQDLSWTIFSLILVIAVVYLASRGLKTIGRVGELYFRIIAFSFIMLLILASTTSSFENLLPLREFDTSAFFKTSFKYSFWFGDFLLVLMFMGKIKDDKKISVKMPIVYAISVMVVSVAYVIFYGIYQSLTVYQTNLTTDISEFTLLALEVGRLDWILILGVQISTVIACAVDVYLASYNFAKIFNIKKSYKLTIFAIAVVYILDIFVFKNLINSAVAVADLTKWLSIFMQILLPLGLFVVAVIFNKKGAKHVGIS